MLAIIVAFACRCVGQAVNIRLAHDSSAEQQAKEQLERLLKQYDPSRYTFTHDVIIEEGVITHSHPVPTLSTRHLKQDDEALSACLHERIHWFLTGRQQQTEAAEVELRKMYPNPRGNEGAQESSNARSINNFLVPIALAQSCSSGRMTITSGFTAPSSKITLTFKM
jgi:hypothetical protein